MLYNLIRVPAIQQFLRSFMPMIISLSWGGCALLKAIVASAQMTSKNCKTPKKNIVVRPLLEDNLEHVKGKNETKL